MANSWSRIPLSGSTHGKRIKVAAVATPGTTIHTAQASASLIDELYLWAFNSDTVERTLTLEWGGVADPDDIFSIVLPIKAEGAGLIQCIPGLVLRNALVLSAFASASNVITVGGYVNRES